MENIEKENVTENTEETPEVKEVFGIRADMTLGDIMQKKPEIIPILMEAGMHCVSCPAALMETLEEAAIVHGMNIDELMEYIEESLKRAENA